MPFINLDASAATPIAGTIAAPTTGGEETLLSMRTELSDLLGGRADLSATRLNRWINQAYRDLAGMIEIPSLNVAFSFSTVAAQPLYLLPVGVSIPREVSLVDATTYPVEGGRKLLRLELGTYRSMPEVLGYPSSYVLEQRLMVIYPTPSDVRVVNVDGYVQPQILVNDTDSTAIGPEWNGLILALARSYAHDALMEWDDGAQALNAFLSRLRSKRDTKAEGRGGEIAAFRPVRSHRGLYRRDDPRNRRDW